MKLIYAEKYDVAIKIAAALDKITLPGGTVVTFKNLPRYKAEAEKLAKKNGYLDIFWNGEPWRVTFGYGHIYGLKDVFEYNKAYKSWSARPECFIPERYELRPNTSKTVQFQKTLERTQKTVGELFRKAEFIINATDDDREGELIFAYVYEATKCKAPFSRVHLSSQTQSGLITAFSNLLPSSATKNRELAGRARSIYDWLIGTNLSTRVTLKMNDRPNPPTRFLVRTMQGCMTAAKNKLMNEKEMARLDDTTLRYCYGIDFPTFFHHYEEYKKQNDVMDFDDQIDLAADLLYNDSRILNHFRSKYQYICIDEVQDTSRLQFEVIDAISDKANLFMVGDDDQSIYGFRGAEPQNILHFTDDYEGGDILHMDTNYRSQRDIITAAAHFISMNKERYKKDFVGAKDEQGFIIVTEKPNEDAFYDTMLDRIRDAGRGNESLGVLAAVNVDLLPVVDKLLEHGITARRRDNFESFFYSPIISELLGFLFLSKEPANFSHFLDCYNGLGIEFSAAALQKIKSSCKKEPNAPVLKAAKQHLNHSAMYSRRIECVMDTLEIASMENPIEAIQTILDMFYSDRITSMMDSGLWDADYCAKMVGILKFLAKRHKTLDDFLEQMIFYKTSSDDSREIDSPVTLSTIHGAKGLEFDHVIIVDAINGVMPLDSEASTSEDDEENARLFYVAVTRAKETVEFIIPAVLFDRLRSRSSYIDILLESVKKYSYEEYLAFKSAHMPCGKEKNSISPTSKPTRKRRSAKKKKAAPPPSAPKCTFLVGMSAQHVVFGRGTVLDINGDVITLDFGTNGIRKIKKAYLNLA